MNKLLILPLVAATAMVGACATTGDGYAYDDGGYGYYDQNTYSQYGNYDYDRPDPRHGGYYADNYYRTDRRYKERRLANNDRVYRGRDNKYYCRRNDGSTGLIVGGIAGGALGAALTSGRSEPLGILLGAAAGAAVGSAVDKNNDVRCR